MHKRDLLHMVAALRSELLNIDNECIDHVRGLHIIVKPPGHSSARDVRVLSAWWNELSWTAKFRNKCPAQEALHGHRRDPE